MREWFELLQERFDALDGAKKWIAASLPFLLAGALAYFLFFEPAMQELELKEQRLARLEQEISKESVKRYEKMIAAKKKELLALRKRIDRVQNKALSLRSKLDAKRVIFLNGANFAKLLENMLQSSVRNRLELTQIAIEDKNIDSVGKLKVKKTMHIQGAGEFLNIVKFVRSIEAQPVLLSVHRFLVETNGTTPSFEVEVDLYGVDG